MLKIGGGGQSNSAQSLPLDSALESKHAIPTTPTQTPNTQAAPTLHHTLPALQARIHHFTKYANIKPFLNAFTQLPESLESLSPESAQHPEATATDPNNDRHATHAHTTYTRATTTRYESKPIAFHLIADTLTPTTLKHLRTLESTLSTIYPTTITIHYQQQEEFATLTPWGEAGANWCAYFRLKIGEILGESTRRCLYLDTDTLALGDVREIFYHDIGECAIGAVRSLFSTAGAIPIVRDGLISPDEYCNSGVLIIDLPKWRTKDLTKIQDFAYTNFPDQDFINVTFKGEIAFLPFAWNMRWLDPRRMHFLPTQESFAHHAPRDENFTAHTSAYSFAEFASALLRPRIVHLLGGYKPWEKSNFEHDPSKPPIFVQNPYHKLWWKIAAQSPFALQLRLAYAKRAIPIWLIAYLRAYAPALYTALRTIKRAIKPIRSHHA